MKYCVLLIFLCTCVRAKNLNAQTAERWQQRVDYVMEIDVDVAENTYDGRQRLTYHNNSPDTLGRLFYHLYFNAFQPGSQMDMRNRNLPDTDERVGERIQKLSEEETGYIRVQSLERADESGLSFEEVGTIIEVTLDDPILPGDSAVLLMEWEAQVPLQIRRSGRDNAEGIEYSMSQWYPKLAEYDYQGWHANPYIGREFHGVWGDFDVTINIDEEYVVAATGYEQDNGQQGSHRFIAPDVHDFVWAADPDYTVIEDQLDDTTTIHYYYQPGEATDENWEALPRVMREAFAYIESHYGNYPYRKYSFIQGGDGGMEYPMATLITGERQFVSLVGVSVHELMHTWYQGLMATNESLYAWMDEGFTSWASNEVMNHLRCEGLIPGDCADNPHARTYASLRGFRQSGIQEPLSVHADHFKTNAAYGVASYVNGAVFLEQLRYIVGEKAFDRTLKRYYDEWAFRHPNPNDFIRIAEKESDLELDWYLEYWVNGVDYADYAITDVEDLDGTGTTRISLERQGRMPMPLEVTVTMNDGGQTVYYLPLAIMRGEKSQPYYANAWRVLDDWGWTDPNYQFTIEVDKADIERIELNARQRMYEDEVNDNAWPDTAGK